MGQCRSATGIAGTGAWRRDGWALVAAFAALAVSVGFAASLPAPIPGSRLGMGPAKGVSVLAWDCWIESGEGGGIRCIADRDTPLPLPEEFTDDDESAEVLLELVHDYLHRGMTRRAGELVHDHFHLLRREDLWSIRLSGPPFETSWDEGRPQKLVRALLCSRQAGCSVRFHR